MARISYFYRSSISINMYPDLSYFFHAVFGTPVDNWTSVFKTFGFFLVLAILGAAFFLYKELKRRAEEELKVGSDSISLKSQNKTEDGIREKVPPRICFAGIHLYLRRQ